MTTERIDVSDLAFNTAVDILKEGKQLKLHNCGICQYECVFLMKEGVLYYDAGCDCTGVVPLLSIEIWNSSDFIQIKNQFKRCGNYYEQ